MALNQVGTQNALTVPGTAVSLTLPSGAMRPSHALIQVSGADIRWRADGTAPTATSGILVAGGSNIQFMDPTIDFTGVIARFQAIRTGSVSATLEAAFFSK